MLASNAIAGGEQNVPHLALVFITRLDDRMLASNAIAVGETKCSKPCRFAYT